MKGFKVLKYFWSEKSILTKKAYKSFIVWLFYNLQPLFWLFILLLGSLKVISLRWKWCQMRACIVPHYFRSKSNLKLIYRASRNFKLKFFSSLNALIWPVLTTLLLVGIPKMTTHQYKWSQMKDCNVSQ